MNARNIIIAAALIVVAVTAWFLRPRVADDQSERTIYIASVVEIQPIADLRTGFREALDATAVGGQVTYVERNAQGDAALMAQIASEIAREQPDLVYVLGTPLAQAIQQQAPDVIVVQGAVTDPVAAGLADSWAGSGRRYAANSDRPPVDEIIALIRELLPRARSIGVIYSASESNSVAVVDELRQSTSRSDITLREYSVGTASDLPAATAAATRGVDVIFVPPDNLVTAGLASIVQSANRRGVGVVATTSDAVEAGALAAVTTDFIDLGRQAGGIAVRILQDGADPASIPIALPENVQIVVNRSTAQAIGARLDGAESASYVLVE